MQQAAFWLAKVLEALGGLLLVAAPLFSLVGLRGADKIGAALIALFLVAVTPLLHPFATDQNNFMKNLSLLGAMLYVIAGNGASSKSPAKTA